MSIRDAHADYIDFEDEIVEVALLWTAGGNLNPRSQQPLIVQDTFPARYTMTLYHPPPEDAFVQPGQHTESQYAYALPIVYVDADLDGALSIGDTVLGRTEDAFLLYLPSTFETPNPAPDQPLIEDRFQPGYNSVMFNGSEETCISQVPRSPEEADPTDIDILIGGNLEEGLPDTDCDGQLDEWALLCGGDCGPA